MLVAECQDALPVDLDLGDVSGAAAGARHGDKLKLLFALLSRLGGKPIDTALSVFEAATWLSVASGSCSGSMLKAPSGCPAPSAPAPPFEPSAAIQTADSVVWPFPKSLQTPRILSCPGGPSVQRE